jgi:tetratricopeptide (TPR) repeat protein
MALTAGDRLGPYEIQSAIGAGGMGEVYRSLDTRLDRVVALKILPGGAAADPAFRERFNREARTISSLSHPNICALFDVGEQDGTAFLVMEYLAGETLAARLARGPMSIDETLSCVIQMAEGLSRAHALGIVHRDLKPGNVMLLEGGVVKLLDFGLAKRFAAEPGDATVGGLSETGVMIGTVAYMSPEQVHGGLVDHRSDIFSLGVVLYEMVAGVRPFDGGSTFSVLQKVTTDEPRPAETYRPSTPPALSALLRAMLSKSPEKRPQSAQDIVRELKAITAAASGAIAGRQPRRLAAVPRRWAAVLTIAAVVLLAFVVSPAVRSRSLKLFSAVYPGAGSTGAVGSAGPAVTPTTAFEWANLGREYLRRFDRKENVDRAIDAFHQAIKIDANHAFAHAGLAEAFLRKDSFTPDPQWIRQATEAAGRSVALNPDLAAGHAAHGLVLLRLKRPEEGRKSLERALDLDPRLVQARLGMGEYYTSTGDLKQAEAVLRKATELAPQEWLPLVQLGRSLFLQSLYADAARVWEQAREKSPDNVLVLRNLGAVYQTIERYDEASAVLQRALEIEPSATLYNNLGTLWFFQGRYSDAVAVFEKAVDLNPTFYQYWANLGDGYRWVPGASDKASQAFSRAVPLVEERLKAAPSDPDLRTRLALYLAKQGDRARALKELGLWETLPQKSPASHFRALLTHEILGDRTAALASLEKALTAGYAFKEIRDEPELAKLRSDARYHRIVADYESRRSTTTAAKEK